MLVFDNGGAAGYGTDADGNPATRVTSRPYSRVIEYDPVTLEVVWTYERPDGPLAGERFPFFSAFLSNAQRLPNGNTLICEGNTGRVFEVTVGGELVWEFTNPVTRSFGRSIYRAYRVPASWIPETFE